MATIGHLSFMDSFVCFQFKANKTGALIKGLCMFGTFQSIMLMYMYILHIYGMCTYQGACRYVLGTCTYHIRGYMSMNVWTYQSFLHGLSGVYTTTFFNYDSKNWKFSSFYSLPWLTLGLTKSYCAEKRYRVNPALRPRIPTPNKTALKVELRFTQL